jgi:hypothetical protein
VTADRFGAVPAGEYTALASVRDSASGRGIPSPVAYGAPAPASTGRTSPRAPALRWRPAVPPQHGAWAFLVVPVLCGFAVAGASPAGWVLLAAWVCAYPTGYYLGRALTARVRRGSWSRLARRERDRAVPWAVLTAALGLPLALTRPWLLGVAVILAVLWAIGLAVAAHRGERSLANDVLLVAQAVVALPLAVAVVAGPADLADALATSTVEATLVVAAYLVGSVVHVKSLLREAGNVTFRRLNLAWHLALAVVSGLLSAWWLIAFIPAMARAILLRPGTRPGVIGGVEAVIAVLVVVAAFLAL